VISTTRKQRFFGALVAFTGLALFGVSAQAADADGNTFESLITKGDVDVSFRYRYEWVEQDCCDPTEPPGGDFDKDANASTVRSRLSFRSGSLYKLQFFVEAEDVRTVIANQYNAGGDNTLSRLDYPEVSDPQTTEINQAYVDYNGFGPLALRLGRQRIDLDNQRFVGGVGWRQNEQTYDAVSATYTHKLFKAFYAYVHEVNRIFGDEVPAGEHEQNGTDLFNVSGDISNWGKLTGYYYRIDDQVTPVFSTVTAGARFAGQRPVQSVAIRYAAEYAYQEDTADNPASYDADYVHADLGVIVKGLDVGVGYELLSGDEDGRFVTPFGTLHAFNGWVDKFIIGGTGNPPGGLEDGYVNLQYKFGDYSAEVQYHQYQSDDSGDDLGSEVDLRVGRPLGTHVRVDLYYGDYDGESDLSATALSDTEKVWFQLMVTL
jgi:Alginate export